MVTTRSAVTKSKSSKSSQTSKSGTSKPGSKRSAAAKAAAETRRDRKLEQLEKNEARRQWTKQYLQGGSHDDFPGLGCGWCTLISPKVDVLSPFEDQGQIEVQTGTEGPEGGSFRISRENGADIVDKDIFLVPFQNVGE